MKKLYVYLTHNYSSTNDIMRLINVHIVFRHILALLVIAFVDVPNSRNLIISKVSFFKEIKSMVSDVCLLFAKVSTRILKKHESFNPQMYRQGYALSTTDNIGLHNLLLDTSAYRMALGFKAIG